MSDLNAATLARIYLQMRDSIKDLEEQIKTIESQKEIISAKLLELCNVEDANTISTPDGTISRRLQANYWTSDWDSFYNFVSKHNAYHLFEKRIHTANMKEFLTEKPEAVPAGLQTNQKYVISVRKPTSK